jgi:3-hydroxyisobutyrate dehydrogenase-like beta-hydroxyacid dehydrogenase
MQYTATKDVSLNGKTIRHYVTSPAGHVVCSTHTAQAAAVLAHILNSHGGQVLGTPVMDWDWSISNEQTQDAA